MIWNRIRIGLAAVLLAMTATSVQAAAGAVGTAVLAQESEHEAPPSMDERIEQWIQALAQTDPFAEWLGASWQKQPLGPGTHGWVVVLSRDGRDIGYLVVEAQADGDFRLGEYGAGDYPLFSLNTLYRELVRQGIYSYTSIDRWYRDGLHALWVVRTADSDIPMLMDARTAEWLPLESVPEADDAKLETAGETGQVPRDADRYRIELTVSGQSFDPYDDLSWLTDAPLSIDKPQLLAEAFDLEGALTFVSKLYDKRITAPFAVTGYQLWADGQLYVRMEHLSTLYLPWGEWTRHGRFYR